MRQRAFRLRAAATSLVAGAMACALASSPLHADEAADYLRHVKPVLAARCYACHGALEQRNGLRLDTAASIRQGGDSGPAIVPGKSGESLLIQHVTGAGGVTRMPPESEGEALTQTQIAAIRRWIDQGAAAPAEEKPEKDPREHWAFRPPVRPLVPKVSASRAAWVHNPIDAFVAAEHDRLRLVPQPTADKRLLLRRVYLDLVGMPPTAEETEAFLADPSPDAYERVVERLLASPRYGERWGRHWMDIWRYSDWWGLGAEVRNSQKHIWHWRDWIVESLNADVGYDQMLREMLAADELYPNDLEKLRATGYLARSYFKFNRNTWLEEVVEHTSKAFLGLTVNCAKCHDHKYDPIKQEDYYRLRAFFEAYQVRTDQVPGETDYEKDGIPRVFDCNLDAPTYLFTRGDERRPVKDRSLTPGLPSILAWEPLRIEPVNLPPEAHHPGLRPFVLEDHLRLAEQQIHVARQKVEAARRHLADAEAQSVTASSGGESSSPVEQAKLALKAAEASLAAQAAQPSSLRARAAADRARFARPPAHEAKELAIAAAKAEAQAALLQAEAALAEAELELSRAASAQKGAAEAKVAAARQAVASARKAAESPGESYTPLRGAIKTLESNLETEASRNKPFPTTSTGRRTALARWMTDARNPLTARVAVNHVWARHFGRPLVATVFDFGRKGSEPTHPALLDYLAVELQDSGWSLKHLHRLMVTSSVYRLSSSSAGAPAAMAIDAENRWYWRMNPVRMDAQTVRDSLLALAGDLDNRMGGPSLHPVQMQASHRRSLYFVHSHNDHHKFLSLFDDANVLECYRRTESIVPQQALAMSNSEFAVEMADRVAARLAQKYSQASDDDFIRTAFAELLGTLPSPQELAACREALTRLQSLSGGASTSESVSRCRARLVHALLNHNDFVTIR